MKIMERRIIDVESHTNSKREITLQIIFLYSIIIWNQIVMKKHSGNESICYRTNSTSTYNMTDQLHSTYIRTYF